MDNSSINRQFLNSLDSESRLEVLSNISSHYGLSVEEAFEEVTGEDAEHLLDYLTGSLREDAQSLMSRHGLY